jgi:hypothetical protein
MKSCPTGYLANDTDGCTITAGSEQILGYFLNFPAATFVNQGTAGTAYDISIVKATDSGKPAKDRGIYFKGSEDGHIALADITLHYDFSFHAWVLIASNPATGKFATLYSKDRNDFNSATSKNWISVAVNDANKVAARLAQLQDASVFTAHESTSALVLKTWYYIAASYAMSAGKDTTVSLFKNNVADGTGTWQKTLIVDESTFKSYVATARATATTYEDKLDGFLYEFFLYQKAHATTNTAHSSSCTGTRCWTGNFNQYYNGTTNTDCDGSCTNSCSRAGVCQTCS